MKPTAALLALASSLAACAPFSQRYVHDAAYVARDVPAAPDYEQPEAWAALPDRADAADVAPPETAYPEAQATAAADVFWIYPTLYTDEPDGRHPWHASVTDAELNERIDDSSVRMQASAFNAAGRVYAPRYRQAHISAYYTGDTAAARAAFDTAYADVRRAFRTFLRKHNRGQRPIIVAGHSQGATHGKRLVRDFFDPAGPRLGGNSLPAKLVAAYLIGMPITRDDFGALPPCETPDQTGCFVSWRTWQRPATPPQQPAGGAGADAAVPVVVNPLSWTTDTAYVPATENPGGTLRKLKLIEHLADAQVHLRRDGDGGLCCGVLWINRPDFFGKRVIRMDNWHAADLNLFYESVRGNAVRRVGAM